jgi:hypothetical protein
MRHFLALCYRCYAKVNVQSSTILTHAHYFERQLLDIYTEIRRKISASQFR